MKFISCRRPFESHTGNLYGEHLYGASSLYIVYSYGHHFPVAVREFQSGRWFYNTDTYSPTTSRHQTLVRSAIANNYIRVDTETLHLLIRHEGRASKMMEEADDDLRAIARIAPTIQALQGYT